MAIKWKKTVNGVRYEVRSAGRTRRLYTDGVCHSEFNPARLLTGSVWDLLTMSAFFSPPGSVRRVLALGVGGGASLLQLRQLVDPDEIIGIELDAVHLDIARRFFDMEHARIDLVQDDARQWLDRYRGEPFDLVIDDLFTGARGEPERAVEADADWFRLLVRHLTRRGALAVNFASRAEFRGCGYFTDAGVARRFRSAFTLGSISLDNVVGIFLRDGADAATLRANLRRVPVLDKALRDRRLRYRIRNVGRKSRRAA